MTEKITTTISNEIALNESGESLELKAIEKALKDDELSRAEVVLLSRQMNSYEETGRTKKLKNELLKKLRVSVIN